MLNKRHRLANAIARLFLTISAISIFVVVYAVKNDYNAFPSLPDNASYLVVYPIFAVFLAAVALWVCKRFSCDLIEEIQFVEFANNDFLPNYLAFFFVALAIPSEICENINCEPPSHPFYNPSFLLIFLVTTTLIYFSRSSYFNPIFLVLGYNFYYIKISEKRGKIMLISKQKLSSPTKFTPANVNRINNYTYIEVEK